ncbi:integrase [Oceanobacillus arenosus]|uniref:Integrase n=1 Tax=Oceanobacillus arenosus TaxID=1229153 RepID=A0A3D8PPM2_9BACI|nr:integrase [Oceanobacillus arenosus]
MLLSEAAKSYEADKRIEDFSPQTLNAYSLQAKLLVNYIGNTKMNDITIQHLKQYLAESSNELKPPEFVYRIRFIRSLFRWSHEEGIIDSNPASKIKEPKVGKRIPKFLTEREIEHLRDACFTPMEKSLFEFMFSTGCRIGEIVTLDRNSINWGSQAAIVRGKGDKEREVYFNIRCDIWLMKYLNSRNDNDSAIFVTERST